MKEKKRLEKRKVLFLILVEGLNLVGSRDDNTMVHQEMTAEAQSTYTHNNTVLSKRGGKKAEEAPF